MHYEVEQKFVVDDLDVVAEQLRVLGGAVAEPVAQADRYFAHPSRDFAATDEALRIRSVGEANFITYKGPKIDATTKTRREIEVAVADGSAAAEQVAAMLAALGFSPVAVVRKHRRTCHLLWNQKPVEVALDEVAEVGQFVEIELAADDESLDDARAVLASLAAELKLSKSERRSYLELLLESRGR